MASVTPLWGSDSFRPQSAGSSDHRKLQSMRGIGADAAASTLLRGDHQAEDEAAEIGGSQLEITGDIGRRYALGPYGFIRE
ncbi:hypothetical protein ACFXPY_40065 [Streptomyces sp. NPDC059153]|uniref:hypothetical protein n=1 Tax=unclassified Streptomyces TaxID=2593676 RepID=UPI0036862A7D